jgi:hypothetical protein
MQAALPADRASNDLAARNRAQNSEQFILEYAQKFGRTHEQIHGYFVREQEILKNLFARSAMPKLLIPNDDPSGGAVERAFHFWNEDVESEKAA